jgi:YD repeat-containing protein
MAQGTTKYVYDDNGRLRAVISPAGEATVWEYDAAGNFTAIRRLTANDLELLAFSPHEGVPGDLVTFTGVGFGGGVSAVSFNGTLSNNVQLTTPFVVAEVPVGATTGPITLTTPRGFVTTPIPFTIRGVRVTPASARVVSGEAVQFTASVVIGGDQGVRWSVNGVEGGNVATGTISTTGLYIAPGLSTGLPSQVFFIRATSVTASQVFGESQVTVRNPLFIRPAISSGVLVQLLESPQLPRQPAISSGVLVQLDSSSQLPILPAISAGVTATKGPSISTITPNIISAGATVTVSITGINLSGATALRCINTNGVDTSITASNITVSADGASFTATVTVGSNAAAGARVVVITATAGGSQSANVGTNTIQITAAAGNEIKRDKTQPRKP